MAWKQILIVYNSAFLCSGQKLYVDFINAHSGSE